MQPADGDLPSIKPEDRPYFEKILNETDDEELSPEEVGRAKAKGNRHARLTRARARAKQERERRIMRLLLKIKNGTPQMRKQAVALRETRCADARMR